MRYINFAIVIVFWAAPVFGLTVESVSDYGPSDQAVHLEILSSTDKEIFEPVENGMESGLIEIVGSVKERSLLEIVEKFICQKYGVIYEH